MPDSGEVYRIEIPVEVIDKTSGITQAAERVTRFEQVAQRSERQLQRMNRTRWQLTVYAVDKASSVLGIIGDRALRLTRGTFRVTIRAVDLVTRPVRSILGWLTSLPGLLGLGAGSAGLIGWPLSLAGNMEQLEIGFATMLGSAEKAKTFLEDMVSFAAKTPFELPDLQESSQLLLAFGFQAERILPMMEAIGNAAAGTGRGAEGIRRVVVALGQMQAKTKVSAQEMMQLTEASIPAWDILAQSMRVSTAQAMKMAEQGLIPASIAINALIRGMNQRFPNMMERQSRTLGGLLSTLRDNARQLATSWGEGLRRAIVPSLARIVDWISANEETVNSWRESLSRVADVIGQSVTRRVEEFAARVKDLVASPAWQNAKSLSEKMKLAWGTIVVEPFTQWWESGGRSWAEDVGKKMAGAILTGMKFVLASGWKAIWSGLKAPFERDDPSTVQREGGLTGANFGRMAVSALALLAGVRWAGRLAQPVFDLGRGLIRGGRWVAQRLAPSAVPAAVEVATTTAPAVEAAAAAAKRAKVVAQAAETAAPAVKAAETAGLRSGLRGLGRGLGRIAVPLGVGLDLWQIARARPGVERARAIGGAAGGWGGAALGAAAGTAILPGIGTVIGAIIGGMGGSILGEKLGGGAAMPSASLAAAGGPMIRITVDVRLDPTYQINTAADAEGVLRVIRRNQRAIADDLGDELAGAIERAWRNMPRQ